MVATVPARNEKDSLHRIQKVFIAIPVGRRKQNILIDQHFLIALLPLCWQAERLRAPLDVI